ncbi:MAG TPA: HD domain-containing protein [Dissulfurispiraceae bacterium]|nr:HD domain-containing protein [Dissulfurispiraceae bacterium]
MTGSDLEYFRAWFASYCKSFCLNDEMEQRNIELKEMHTGQVCANIISVAKGESLDSSRMRMAEAVALFHDVGRFPQYAKYKTFRDSASINHGPLGSTVLKDEKVLDRLPLHERTIIFDAVRLHNAFSIADISDPETLLFLKLIRDADKLDIWRVFIEYYETPEERKPEAVGLGLPDMPSYSREILSGLQSRKIASLAQLKTLNDFKLLQLSWVFDLNFRTSFIILKERGYIAGISSTLPRTEEVLSAVKIVQSYVDERLNG